MYTIIGGDGREYGPVSADQLRQWIATGRANGATRTKAAGSEEWKPLAEFAEFSFLAASAAPATTTGESNPAGRAVNFDPIECYSRSWKLLKANFWPFVGLFFFITVGAMVLSIVPQIPVFGAIIAHPSLPPPRPLWSQIGGPLLSIFVLQPLVAGTFYYLLKHARGEPGGVSDVFAGFTRAYWPLVGAYLSMVICCLFGLVCLILPGIYLGVAFSLTPLIVIDRQCGPWTAMGISLRAIKGHWWAMFLVFVLAVVFAFMGVIALFVGLFVATPLIYGAMVYAYLDLVPPVIASQPVAS